MASEPNAAFQRSNAYFQNNNPYPAYDSAMANGGHDFAAAQGGWNYNAEHLNTPHTQDPSPSLYQGWHHSQQHPSSNNQNFATSHDSGYGKPLPTSSSQFQRDPYGGATQFNRQGRPEHLPFDVSGMSAGQGSESSSTSLRNSNAQVGTIAPGALQQQPTTFPAPTGIGTSTQIPSGQEKGSQEGPRWVPKGSVSGTFAIVNPDALAKVTNAKRLHNFVHIGDDPLEIWSTKTTIPSYIPRKSRNEIKQLLASDGGYTAKLAKKSSKRSGDRSAKIVGATPSTATVLKRENTRTEDAASSPEDPSTDDDSESDESEEESMKPPLPPVRPTRAIEAVKFDTIKTLWRVPYRSATDDDIRKGLADFWEIVRTIRDRWKLDLQTVKDAEEAKKANELPMLNERVANQRDMLETALVAAVAEGHKDIIEHLGENLQLVLALSQFLRDRIASSDYSSSFSRAILELLSKCKTLTALSLEKTGVTKFLPRFAKRGDDKVKLLVKRITDNANNASKKRKEPMKPSNTISSQAKDNSVASPTAESPVAGIKRARPTESNTEQVTKRVAAEAPSGNTVNLVSQPKATTTVKRLPSSSDTKSAASATVGAPVKKATQVVAKPSSFFSSNFAGLQSAKKVSSVNAARPATVVKAASPSAKVVTPVVAAVKTSVAVPKPAFSIADTLASVSKPREVETVAKREETAPPETVEEKAKRLRKEERRKLRVTFKPESTLVEIRVLSPQPEDELDRNAYEVRDAADVDSEGRMFKLKHHEDVMDIDDDDEAEEAPMDDLNRSYPHVKLIDFSTVPDDERQRMYIPFGGGVQKPDCPEAETQERREANTLIVLYAQQSDIPPSPKEPNEVAEESRDVKEFGPPSDFVLTRLDSIQNMQKPATATPLPISKSVLDALLSVIPQQPQQPLHLQQQHALPLPPPPQPQQPQQQSAAPQESKSELEKIFAQFSVPAATASAPQPAFQPQPQPNPPQQQSQTPFPFANLQSLFGGVMAEPQSLQPMPQQQPLQQPTSFQPPPQAAPAMPDNLSSILASLQHSGQLRGMLNNVAAPAPSGMPDYSHFSTQQQQSQQQQSQQQQAYPFENPERRRWIDSGGDEDMEQPSQERGGGGGGSGGGGRRGKQWGGGREKKREEGRPTPKFVVQCKYWKEGKCRKGAECTYLHT